MLKFTPRKSLVLATAAFLVAGSSAVMAQQGDVSAGNTEAGTYSAPSGGSTPPPIWGYFNEDGYFVGVNGGNGSASAGAGTNSGGTQSGVGAQTGAPETACTEGLDIPYDCE